jgi:hypothetical protein
MFGSKLKTNKITSPLVKGDHPKIDDSEFLEEEGIQKYQSLIRQLQWAILLGRFNIAVAIMTMMSAFRSASRKGNLDRVKQIYGYLSKMRYSAIQICTEDGRLAVSIAGVIGTKEEVERVKDVAPGLAQVLGSALAQSKEIIDKYVNVGEPGSCRFQDRVRWHWWGRWCGESFEGVSRGLVGDPPGVVDEFGRRLGGGAEIGGGFHEPHGEREVETDEGFGVAWVWRHHKCEFREVSESEPDPHVRAGKVDLGHVDGSVAGVGINDCME